MVKTKGKIWVSRHYKGEDTTEEKDLEVQIFETEPARVKVSYGLTINLGNYESARCDAGVELPVYAEEIEEGFKAAWDIAKEEIQEQTKDLK